MHKSLKSIVLGSICIASTYDSIASQPVSANFEYERKYVPFVIPQTPKIKTETLFWFSGDKQGTTVKSGLRLDLYGINITASATMYFRDSLERVQPEIKLYLPLSNNISFQASFNKRLDNWSTRSTIPTLAMSTTYRF